MRLAIVGAGPTGLAAAYALRDSALDVVVLEKSRGVSGRAATRWRDVPGPDGIPFRWHYDHGAQYLAPDPGGRAARLIREELPSAGLTAVDGAVWPFDDDGTLRPDHARPDPGPRWTYRGGIADLGRRLRDATPGLDLRLQTRVTRLDRQPEGWAVECEGGRRLDGFDAVLLTAPAPQAADLLRASAGPADLGAYADALSAASYRSQFTVVWAFGHVLERPGPVYALVNRPAGAAGSHDVAWLSVESDKPNRAPDGSTLLLAQMGPAWTAAHYNAAPRDVVAQAAHSVGRLWGPLPRPLWTDTQRWRYALPSAEADTATLATAAEHGLFFAGDFSASKGRVHLALEEGLAVADRILRRWG